MTPGFPCVFRALLFRLAPLVEDLFTFMPRRPLLAISSGCSELRWPRFGGQSEVSHIRRGAHVSKAVVACVGVSTRRAFLTFSQSGSEQKESVNRGKESPKSGSRSVGSTTSEGNITLAVILFDVPRVRCCNVLGLEERQLWPWELADFKGVRGQVNRPMHWLLVMSTIL